MVKKVHFKKFKKVNFNNRKFKKQNYVSLKKEQEKQKLYQEKLIKIFNILIKKKKKFNIQKKILCLINQCEFNKKLNLFIKSNSLSQKFKRRIKFRRLLIFSKKGLKKFKKNKYRYKKKKLKKKLDTYLKFLLLNNYSLLNKIKKKFFNKKKKYLLCINIRSNNIFINLFCFKKSKLHLIKFWSCGILKLHCTKRKLKFIVYTMLKEIKKKLKYLSFFIIKIFCAHFLHKFLYRNFKKLFLRSTFIIFNSFKIFNGCRSKKKRRKKHLKFRVFR